MVNAIHVLCFAFAAFVPASPGASVAAGVQDTPSSVPGWNRLTAESVKPLANLGKVELEAPGRFRLEADISGATANRAAWDFVLDIDMRRQIGLEFGFFCSDVSPFSGFNVYLESGGGWYVAKFAPAVEGEWHRVRLKKSAFTVTEGKVKGWGRIGTVRVSGWTCGGSNVVFGVKDLSFIGFEGPAAGIVRADSCIADPKFRSERRSLSGFASATAAALEDAGMNVFEISDMELDRDVLRGLKLLVFPYNPKLPEGKDAVLREFVDGGGRLFACHSQSPAVRKAMGLDPAKYRNRNLRSSSEKPSREKNGFYLPHVWRYNPDESACRAYDLLVSVEPSWRPVLDAAREKTRKELRKEREWIAKQPSVKGEWRALWCHSARGLGGDHDWESSVKVLKENGFNALVPNLAWGGTAYYRSSVLPEHPSVAAEGDAFDACMKACRKYGVECHVWKVCWRMGRGTDGEFIRKMSEAGRLQKKHDGSGNGMWLCPSHPENLKLEVDAFRELAAKGPDGIHFDYIRYPDESHCFCGGCRLRFEKSLGRKVGNWPADVRKNGALVDEWSRFRRGNITALVREVSAAVRRECPGVRISAAVFHDFRTVPSSIGQDWISWCRAGYLDFVCPMNYYGGSDLVFGNTVRSQLKALEGCDVKMRAGLGLSCWEDRRRDALTLTRQILIAREAGLDGFIVFNFDSRAERVLPVIRTGPVRPDPGLKGQNLLIQ